MPSKTSKIKASNIKSYEAIIGGPKTPWKPGVISLVAPDRIPAGAVVEARNMMQTQDGVWQTRWGSANYGEAWNGPITGFQDFITYDNGQPTQLYMIMDAGILRYAEDGEGWTDILVPAGTPTAPTATKETGTGLGTGVYKYKVTFLAGGGETLPSTDGDVTTSSGDNKVALTDIATGPSGVNGRNIYRTAVGGSTYFLLTTINDNTTTTYADTTADGSLGTQNPPSNDTSTILFDTTTWTNMLQYENKLLICNGINQFSYVDLTNMTWVGFTTVSAPTDLASSLENLTTGDFNLYYQVTAFTNVGETLPTSALTVNVNLDRNAWYNPNATNITTASSYGVTLTWDAPDTGADSVIGYNIYLSDGVAGVSYFLDSVNSSETTYQDWGFAAVNDFIQVPNSNTTSAPEFNWIALSDNRLYACGDPNNPNRIYFAGTGTEYALAFNPAVGGGYVDILPGGPQLPIVIRQFRNGQGSPMTTIWESEPSGYGSMWHLQVTTDTIGNTVVAVPTVIQAMGTFGTTAPRSVVETNQNTYYYSGGPAGIYSNGSVPTLFNILATNEISLLVRPDIQAITLSSSGNICGIEYNRKLWFSVPYGSTDNNRIMIYDLEKENWNPFAFDFGITQFIHYRDNEGILHLLGIPADPTDGNYIIEINEDFLNDNGNAFEAHLQTGLIHPTPDHVQFVQTRYAFYEFSSPQGEITVIFSGTPKNLPLDQLQLDTFTAGDTDATNVGFSSYAFSTKPFSFVDVAPTITAELSVKKRMLVNQLINNFEAEVSSFNSNTQWTLNQIIVQGFIIPTAAPSSWILN